MSEWGRVAEDGTVFVRVGEGEREVGQYPEGTPEEALAFFVKRYDDLAFEVGLLEQRVRAEALGPDEATQAVRTLSGQVEQARAVGDLTALSARLDGLLPVIGLQRGRRREDRARKTAESRERKEQIVVEAERIAAGTDWRGGVGRLRDLLTEWKALPRVDKRTDDALWHRFSSARTTYTRHRKAHFAELSERREGARAVKERLVREAEALATSTDWGPTSGRYRDLMREWKAAGPAPRDVEDDLWARFRGAQDTFFSARDAANAEQDKEYAANAEVKRALLEEAERLVPVTDVDAARAAFRDIATRWDDAGRVPRDQMKELEARMRKVESAVRSAEDAQWRRSDPEKTARADDLVGKLAATIERLEADQARARENGDAKRVTELEETLANQRAFLEMARRTASELSG